MSTRRGGGGGGCRTELAWPSPRFPGVGGAPLLFKSPGPECSRPPEGMLAGHFVTLGELCPPPAQGQPPWEGQRPASGSSQSLSSQLQPPCLSPAAGRGSGRPSQETGAVLGPPFPYLGPWAPNPCSEPGGGGEMSCRDGAPGTRAPLPRLCWVARLCPLLAPSCLAATGGCGWHGWGGCGQSRGGHVECGRSWWGSAL